MSDLIKQALILLVFFSASSCSIFSDERYLGKVEVIV